MRLAKQRRKRRVVRTAASRGRSRLPKSRVVFGGAPERFRSSAGKAIVHPAAKLFFPLDLALKLGVEGYAPAVLRQIVDQGGRYAFGEAAQNLKKLAGVPISAQHVQRLTERIGRERAEQRDRESDAFQQNTLARGCAQT